MKKLFFILGAFSVVTVNAEPPKEFSHIIQNFAHQNALQFTNEFVSDNQESRWTYAFAPTQNCKGAACSGMAVTFSYMTKNECLYEPDLFGDLPIMVNRRFQGIFSIPTLTDNTSQARDFLTVYDEKGGCYEISYGQLG